MSDTHSPSGASSQTDLTATDVELGGVGQATKGGKLGAASFPRLFEAPGTFPLADAGHHHLGVCFENLTVYGSGATRKTVEGLETSLLKMWDFPSFISKLLNIKWGHTRPLISDFVGVVPAGETLLVLGRPGSGCSTLLRALANVRSPFAKVEGDVQYGTISAKEASKYYEGEIVFNSEEDTHTAQLTVAQTLDVALSLKKPRHLDGAPMRRRNFVQEYTGRILRTFGMPHVANTFVGNDFIRGVSGGERKRVSLAEILTISASVNCWDNSVRGLDSAVALHYLKVLKELSMSTGMSNIVSIYQASQEMYDVAFDRVLVIYEGHMIFSGQTSDAEKYFVDQGWYKNPRQTTPDFLTSCTSITERRVREDYIGPPPAATPIEMANHFRQSPYFAKLQDDIASYKAHHQHTDNTERFRTAVRHSKHALTGKANPYRANFGSQVLALTRSQLQLIKADPRTFTIRIGSNILQATLVGAVCYKPAADASGSFAIAGGLFFSLLYYCIFSFGEIPSTVMSRPLLIKHRVLGFYNPAAFTVAQMVTDVPVYAIQTLLFSTIFYFLVGLNKGAEYFFTFWFIVFSTYLSLSVMYRMIGSWSPNLSVALRYGGLTLAIVLSVAGFILPVPTQLAWFSWGRRISPVAYGLEALMGNEFRTRTLTCSATDLVPAGPSYGEIQYQGCTITGGVPGSATVSGTTFIEMQYGFSSANIWRNVGILWAFYVIYAIFVVIGSTLLIKDTGSASAKLYKQGAVIPDQAQRAVPQAGAEDEKKEVGNFDHLPVYTFRNVKYTVKVAGEDRVLLDNITGVVKPGELMALMGASGAGKTTALNSLRQTLDGRVDGEFLIDGKALGAAFARNCGFVMQGDIHEPFSTVRECLQFSALLRQSSRYSREEKLAYAEEVIDLLELGPIADALVGNMEVGGLGVEERKRLTIGVELAARPDSLLFLDEPTSGLDSQAAFEIVRFLRKIAGSGLAVCASIHQPSGDLFEMFDSVTLLKSGGKTVYAGPTGKHASTVTEYFSRYGAHCPRSANPAEFIISTVAPVGGTSVDWPQYWKESDESRQLEEYIATVSARNQHKSSGSEANEAAFAAPYQVQTLELVKRNLRAQWRDGPYYTTKLVVLIFFGLFTGFYHFKMTHSIAGIQGLNLAILMIVQAAPPLSLDIAVYFQSKMDIYTARERNGVYAWYSLVSALLIVEIPVMVVGWVLLFFTSFWTMGLDSSAGAGGLTFLTLLTFAVFTTTFGALLGAVSPTPFSVPFVLSLVWNLFMVLSWALVPWPTMPSPFKWFFSWLSPIKYAFGALMTSVISPLTVACSESELTRFNVPSGQTCGEYAAAFLTTAPGYLANPDATSNCGYCQMSSGNDYMSTLGYDPADRWRDWGIFLVFCVSNIFFVFVATYLLRIRTLKKK